MNKYTRDCAVKPYKSSKKWSNGAWDPKTPF